MTMLLSFALIALFSLTASVVAWVLVDSALQACNAYGELRRAVGSTHSITPLLRRLEVIEIGKLPAFRAGQSVRPPSQRTLVDCSRQLANVAA